MKDEESFSLEALIFLLILAVYVLASYFIDKYKIAFLHQSTIAIFLGFLTALILKLTMERNIQFSNDIFFSLLLPPIVFSVGYEIKKAQFFNNFFSIAFLGIFSTILGIVLFSTILVTLNSITKVLSFKDILLISIIISANDPIAALPLIKNNHPTLNAIVSGESIFNSSVVIILFGTISSINSDTAGLDLNMALTILFDFAYLFFFSLLLGIFFGLAMSYIFKRFQSFSSEPIKETSLILLIGYVVYLIGQLVGLSGIISLFTTAVIFSLYGFNNLSSEAKHGTVIAFETVRYMSQAFIFTYLGASILTTQGQWSALSIAIIIICLIPFIRFISIILLPLSFKIVKKPFMLSNGEEKMVWYSGLMRGVIAFALSLQIQSENRLYMITISLIVVMSTTIVGATFLKSFATRIGLMEIELIHSGDSKAEQRQIQLIPATKYEIIGGVEELGTTTNNKQQGFKTFEQKFIKPLFIKETHQKKQNTKIGLFS